MSAGARISLSGEGLVESCDGTWRDQYMNVYTLREPGESAHIQLGRGEGATVSLTPSEAVQVAAALLNAVTLAQATAG
jgi:hypothetical protein